MMKQVKTARGKIIDMAALAKSNENLRAVSPGKTKMNAKGDIIDQKGNVVQTVQARSHAARNTTDAPMSKKMSDLEKGVETPQKKKIAPKVVSKQEKVRSDGSRYLEIEYDDGSIDVEEIN